MTDEKHRMHVQYGLTVVKPMFASTLVVGAPVKQPFRLPKWAKSLIVLFGTVAAVFASMLVVPHQLAFLGGLVIGMIAFLVWLNWTVEDSWP